MSTQCPYPSCGRDAPEDAKFCPTCLKRLAYCGNCHSVNRTLAKYCRRCGKRMVGSPEWPTTRGDFEFTAYVPFSTGFEALASADMLPQAWPTQAGSGRHQVLSPIVSAHGLLIVCSTRGRVTIMNRCDGSRLAEFSIGDEGEEGEYSALVAEHWLIAAGHRSVSAYNLLHSFKGWEAGGPFRMSREWTYLLPAGERIRRSINRVSTGSGDAKAILFTTENGSERRMHALSEEKGLALWKEPIVMAAALSAPVAGEGAWAYALGDDGRVHKIDVAGGTAQSSSPLAVPARVELAPVRQGERLFFFDVEGALVTCLCGSAAPGVPARSSDAKLHVVTGFAVGPLGVLASCSRGLAMLSFAGRPLWTGEGGMDAGGCPPAIAGDIGFGIAQNRNVLYVCDIRANSPRYQQFQLEAGPTLAGPAFVDGVLYTCSLDGSVSSTRIHTT